MQSSSMKHIDVLGQVLCELQLVRQCELSQVQLERDIVFAPSLTHSGIERFSLNERLVLDQEVLALVF